MSEAALVYAAQDSHVAATCTVLSLGTIKGLVKRSDSYSPGTVGGDEIKK